MRRGDQYGNQSKTVTVLFLYDDNLINDYEITAI